MTDTHREGRIDQRYSIPDRPPSSWEDAERVLAAAELYWFSSVRTDRRPHVTPMVGVWHEGAFHFSTGSRERCVPQEVLRSSRSMMLAASQSPS